MAAFDLNAHSLADNSNKVPKTWSHPVPHSLWSPEVLENVEITHKPPKGFVDRTARFTCWWLRFWFDIFAGFKFGKVTEKKFINRLVFLETVAGVPGMVAGMVRHLHSLRRLKRDNGWIHTLLEEAENERMHLLTFMEMKKPGLIFRLALLVSQGVFFNFFFVAYLISPLYCHRLVGYIEEEAVRTYTKLLHEVEAGNLFKNTACPPIAVAYWRLGEKATFRDLVLAVRADEAGHRLANHTFADMHQAHHGDHPNPFVAMTPANTNAVHHDSKKDGKDPC